MPAYISNFSDARQDAWGEGWEIWLDCNESETWILSDEKLDETSELAAAGYYSGMMSQNNEANGYVVFVDHEVEYATPRALHRLCKELNIPTDDAVYTPGPEPGPAEEIRDDKGNLVGVFVPDDPDDEDEEACQYLIDLLWSAGYVTIG